MLCWYWPMTIRAYLSAEYNCSGNVVKNEWTTEYMNEDFLTEGRLALDSDRGKLPKYYRKSWFNMLKGFHGIPVISTVTLTATELGCYCVK